MRSSSVNLPGYPQRLSQSGNIVLMACSESRQLSASRPFKVRSFVLFLKGRHCANGKIPETKAHGEVHCAFCSRTTRELGQIAQRTSPSTACFRYRKCVSVKANLGMTRAAAPHNQPHHEFGTINLTIGRVSALCTMNLTIAEAEKYRVLMTCWFVFFKK